MNRELISQVIGVVIGIAVLGGLFTLFLMSVYDIKIFVMLVFIIWGAIWFVLKNYFS